MEVNPQPPPLVPSAVAQDKLSELGCWYSALLQQPHSLDTVYECVYGRLRVHFCACSLLCVRAHESVIPLCLHVWVCVSQFFVCVARFNLSPPPPPPSIQSNLRWNKNLTLEGPEATKCTQHRPQQLPTESHGHKYTDPYLPVLSTRFNGGTRG